MLTNEQIQSAAQTLYQCEMDSVLAEPISLIYPEADITDAYRIAQVVTDLKVVGGRAVKGTKIGLISKAMREATNAKEPDFGNIFDNWFVDEGRNQ